MADYSAVNRSAVITGASAQVDRIFLSGSTSGKILEILNVSGGARLSAITDGTAAAQDAAENLCVPAVAGSFVRLQATAAKTTGGGQIFVSVICSGTTTYQVSLVQAEFNTRGL